MGKASLRERMRSSIQRHLFKPSLLDTISVLERFDVEGAQSTVHNWVRMVDPQPTAGSQPTHLALDETVIQFDRQDYWLDAATIPKPTNFSV